MLNDAHRHRAYKSAIQRAVKRIHSRGETVRLLDIGTGTGLLALYAAEAGADLIVACESNHTMANIARAVIKDNEHKYKESCRIVVQAVSSCDMISVNPEYKKTFNIIVSEVYDSELVGEGCLITYKHALTTLSTKNCIFIPSRATLFAQPMFSTSLDSFCPLPLFNDSCQQRTHISLKLPWEVHVDKMAGVQLGQQVELWQWEFNQESIESWMGSKNIRVPNDKICNGVIVWWKSDIDDQNSISTAPSSHKDFQEFRDHWMPLIYPLCTQKEHDLSLRINITELEIDVSHLECNCVNETDMIPAEMLNYRYIGYMNCSRLNQAYCDRSSKLLQSSTCNKLYYIGSPSTLPVLISRNLSCPVETVPASDVMRKSDDYTGAIVIDSCYDPFCLTSVSYYYKRELLERSLRSHDISLLPDKVVLFVTLVESTQLSNRVLSPDSIDGFNISSFSNLVKKCLREQVGDDMFDPVYLWEYEYRTLSTPTQLPSFHSCGDDFTAVFPVFQNGLVTNALFSLGFYFGDSLIQFGATDYFAKVDCYTFVDALQVERGDNVCIDFKLQNCQMVSFNAYKS